MKKLTLYFIMLSLPTLAQQAFYDVTIGNGNGVRFWQTDSYKIHMGNGTEYNYGPVTDYSIKLNMNNDPARGWTWGTPGATPIAAMNTQGNFQIANSFTVGGDIILPSVSGNKQIYTWSPNDANWRIGMSINPGFTRSLATGHIEYLTYGTATGQGFAVGVNGGNSSFEVQGSDHKAFFRGNVGIGTVPSATALTIKGAAAAEETVVNISNMSDQDFAVRLSAVGAATKRTIIGPSTPTRLSLGVGVAAGNEYLTVVNGGNVGIGTTTPQTGLSVSSTMEDQLHLSRKTGSAGDNVYLVFSHSDNTSSANARARIGVNIKAGGYGRLVFQTGAGGTTTEQMRIDENGNVGIGTTSPNQKLTVNGTIYGKEVKVDLNVPGPDYVFEKDYRLPSLEEIKSYIDQHKHLPEVPSAKEMEKDGVKVGEMEMVLLKKIEELTLHLIKVNEKLDLVIEENANLKKQLK